MTIEVLTQIILAAATKVPLAAFVFGGSFIEEIISPIPTYAVMATAGSVAHLQHVFFPWLFALAILGATGKTLACLIYYVLADVFEDVIVPRYGKYVGITHTQIESLGLRMSKCERDVGLLILLRALPIIPSAPISIVAGLIHVEMKVFIFTTFVGTLLKDSVYLTLGYIGLQVFKDLLGETALLGRLFETGLTLMVGLLIGWVLWNKRKR